MSIAKIIARKNLSSKNFIIVGILALILSFLFYSPESILINGKPINGFKEVFPILLSIIVFFGCIIATFISAGSIPSEYESSRNHLVYIRGIKQPVYHLNMMLGNVFSSIMYYLIIYIPVVIVAIKYKSDVNLLKLVVLFFISALGIIFISVLSTTISNIGGFVLGVIFGVIFTILGSMHNLLESLSNMTEGILSKVINILLSISPNIEDSLNFGENYLFNNKLDYKIIIYLVIAIIIAIVVLPLCKRKND
ncbi:hypothetical protein [Miniphocaeibacter massiliensis]|uniref:hypothetical protein n=1 Tax=Miniphocaeibacter massiliensis TaxID=2041841 RepID=UPI000C1B9D17|nr:hypothetical protein [Miniphocaeibacter massiliensis]